MLDWPDHSNFIHSDKLTHLHVGNLFFFERAQAIGLTRSSFAELHAAELDTYLDKSLVKSSP